MKSLFRFQKRVNVKFLGQMVGSLAVLAVGVHFLHGYQVRRNAGNLLGQSDRAGEQGHLERAADYLKRYLGFMPGDTDALEKYGLMLADERLAISPRARLRAFLALQQVLLREPERHAVRRQLVQVAMNLRRYTDAREHLEVLLQLASDDAELEHLLGECAEANGQYAQAAGWFGKAVEHAPDRTESYVRQAQLLRRRLGESKQADAVMDGLVKQNPHSAAARLARARYRKEAGALDAAAGDVAEALKLAPEAVDVLLAAAEVAEAQGQPGRAREHLQLGARLHPRQAPLHHALAAVELRDGHKTEAIACLRQSLKTLPDEPQAVWSAANLFIEAGELADARALLPRLAKDAAAPLLDYLRARLLLAERQWLLAGRAFEQVRPRLVQHPELIWQADLYLGQCYGQLGNADLQLAACRRAVSQEPLQVSARIALGAALLASGRFEEALDEYRWLVTRVPAARIPVARLLFLRALRLPPTQRRWEEVEQVLTEAERAEPASPHVPILRAEMLAVQGKSTEARELLAAARDRQPDQPELWIALAAVAVRAGDSAAGLRVLAEAEQRLGERVEWRVARVRHWSRRRGEEARAALTELERDLGKGADDEQLMLLNELADAWYLAGDAARAERFWRQVAERQPAQLRVRLRLFDLALNTGDEAALIKLLDEIRGIEGEGALWHYGEAARLTLRIRQGKDDDAFAAARAHLAAVASQRAGWSRVPLLEADLEELDGNPERAVECYQRAIELGHRQPATIRRLVQLLFERRRYAEAEQVIRKLNDQDEAPLSGDLGRLAAEIALGSQQRERALELAGRAVATDSRDYRDHLWLGHILWAGGQTAPAEASLRQATRLAEQVPDAWVALVHFLARTGQKERAEAALQQARIKLTGEFARLALAQCYEAVGQQAQAEAEYVAARAERSDDLRACRALAEFYLRTGRPERAEAPLRQLQDRSEPAAAAEAAWARRNLAVVLALRGDFEQLGDALALLERNHGSRREADVDRRARAVILALQSHRRRDAIRLFEDLFRRQPPAAHEQFLLARLYEADRDWTKAREQFLSLLTSPAGANALYVAHYVGSLLRKGEVADARGWLTKLEKLEADSWRTVELQARVLHAENRVAEAAKVLQTHAARPGASLASVAAVLEQLGQAAAAEALYRQDAAQSFDPRSTLALAEFLGRQNRIEEALGLCERAWQTCPPAAVAGASLVIVRSGQAEPRQIQRVEGWLRAALAKEPKAVAILTAWAEIQDLQRQYDEAQRTYRRILEYDPRQVVALNNLAWLQALKFNAADEALELMQRAIAIAGPLPDLLDTRGSIHLAIGQADPAVQDLEQAVAEAPAAALYFHLAQAYHLAKNRGAAAQALRRAQSAGLAPTRLHPLERRGYESLLAELAQK